MELNKIIRKVIDDKLDKLNVALPARILKYDSSKLRGNIELLAKKELNGEQVTYPPILEVPVSSIRAGTFVIIPPYQKGDVVQVLFNQKALDKLLITGEPEEVQYKRSFSLDDAVIIGGLQVEQADDLPNVGENLYIGSQDGETNIEITPGGEININCSTANINADEVNLAGGGAGIARQGDSVQVEVTGGSSAGVYTGSITSGSNKVSSG
ncbi:hypothetical protein GM661_00575 [Iocasia frigidifontis]|uniref:Phage protein Gp138 N-terminal domain-containing protein n=1 Tax=Iocasia fonsfrigidae TaxID=2682810 RepID=A0A8A7KAL3_9FIRM|nr:Gp138 family membrane-puncturing spike protein [Iocasia fonsfrigidae]QTL96568.1 hypothetical protein GM661_00575 [Iocasia fonsfrigidae]